jgi:ABC-type polysaccharide/polyol phosphate transport system ATPase subunit
MDSSIVAENLSVEFPIIGAARSFRSELLVSAVGGLIKRPGSGGTKSRMVVVEALKDISFSLTSGDRLGLIGHNGAGKSTLLRTLAGRFMPTSGTLTVTGKIMPLLSLGVGMDGDFTGYENITLSGLYMGMSHKEIDSVIDDIADFTDLGDFLNLPMRTYSAGMQLRLSFAIATAFHPDILLVDEVFGAGDASFYQKAEKRMETMLEKSSIFVLASHSIGLIQQYCNKACVMEKGRIAFIGDSKDAIQFYNESLAV